MECITQSRLQPRSHQRRVVEAITSDQRAIGVIHSTGSGKTLTAVIAARCWLHPDSDDSAFDSRRVMVISPASLQANFVKEYIASYPDESNTVDPRITITTFDGFAKNPVSLEDHMLIVDEVHVIKTKIMAKGDMAVKGKKAHAIVKASMKASKVLLLTATPLINTEYDIENMLSIIDARMPRTEQVFYRGLSDVNVKREMLEGRFDFYKPTADDLREYPQLVKSQVFFEMPLNVYKEYKIQEDLLSGTNREIDALVTGAADSHAMTNFYIGLRIASNLEETDPVKEFRRDKAHWIANMMKNSPGEKWLVYSEYLEHGLNIVGSVLDEENIKYQTFTGRVSPGARQDIIDKANIPLDPDAPAEALLVSRAGGTGIDLKGFTRVVVLESAWNFATIDQVFGRVVRFRSLMGTRFNTVHAYLMMMVKPNEYVAGPELVINTVGNVFEGRLKSIDLLMYARSLAKKNRVESLFRDIEIYNTELAATTEQLKQGSAKLLADLEEFRIFLSIDPEVAILMKSDTVDITGYTVVYTPEATFDVQVALRLMSIPVYTPLAILNKLRLALTPECPWHFDSHGDAIHIYGVVQMKGAHELTFDQLTRMIETTAAVEGPGCVGCTGLWDVVNEIVPYINLETEGWSHFDFTMQMRWLKRMKRSIGCISSKFLGSRKLIVNEIDVVDRRMTVKLW